jgi:hypothetical protein
MRWTPCLRGAWRWQFPRTRDCTDSALSPVSVSHRRSFGNAINAVTRTTETASSMPLESGGKLRRFPQVRDIEGNGQEVAVGAFWAGPLVLNDAVDVPQQQPAAKQLERSWPGQGSRAREGSRPRSDHLSQLPMSRPRRLDPTVLADFDRRAAPAVEPRGHREQRGRVFCSGTRPSALSCNRPVRRAASAPVNQPRLHRCARTSPARPRRRRARRW